MPAPWSILPTPPPLTYTEDAYLQDCLDRRETSCASFSRDNGGFSATAESSEERLVFFSVPYEDGWSAQVNGEPAEIVKVNVGFMAVKVPAGTAEIRFNYHTPGLNAGLVITAGSVLVLAAYVLLSRKLKKAPTSAPAAMEESSAPTTEE